MKVNPVKRETPRIKPKKRVAAYARVSMESERLKHSLSAQISRYSEYIRNNPEWEYAGVYADDAVSGTGTGNREEFKRLMDDCEKGLIDIVLVKSVSRFARNTVDLLSAVRRLRELGVEVRFEEENIRSLDGDGELMLSILASFAQEESRSVSENVKWGIRKKYISGRARNCRIFGYRTVNGKYAVKEDEAETVRRIFRMFLDGESCSSIARKLKEEGVKSYCGKSIPCPTVGNILRQEKYTGCTLAQKYFTTDHVTHRQVKNRGELPMYWIEDSHPAIISLETFRRAQEEIAERYNVEIVNGRAERRKLHDKKGRVRCERPKKYDFSEFIRCEKCGGLFRAQKYRSSGGEYLVWTDTNHSARDCSPRPAVLHDDLLKRQISSFFSREFGDWFFELVGNITVDGDKIILHFKDGTKRQFVYRRET